MAQEWVSLTAIDTHGNLICSRLAELGIEAQCEGLSLKAPIDTERFAIGKEGITARDGRVIIRHQRDRWNRPCVSIEVAPEPEVVTAPPSELGLGGTTDVANGHAEPWEAP